jgi:hypothetical protein
MLFSLSPLLSKRHDYSIQCYDSAGVKQTTGVQKRGLRGVFGG